MAKSPTPRRRGKRRPVTGRASADPSTRCLAEYRHDWEGHVFVERNRFGDKRWTAREECLRCGSTRVIHMIPETCEETSRFYDHPEEYDTQADREEAKRRVFRAMMDEDTAAEVES
jgi:hypothetical protein